MKILPILAAAAAVALAIPAANAAAPAAPGLAKVEIQHHRPHARKRVYWRKVCTTRWNHGHRQRVCRNVKAWR